MKLFTFSQLMKNCIYDINSLQKTLSSKQEVLQSGDDMTQPNTRIVNAHRSTRKLSWISVFTISKLASMVKKLIAIDLNMIHAHYIGFAHSLNLAEQSNFHNIMF